MKVDVLTQQGKTAGSANVADAVFAQSWNSNMVHDVIVSLQSNLRRGTAHTKDRSDVSGGGKKPWKQKGTGRARHGSTRSPIWVGGGVSHGPRSDKNYAKKINKKVRAKALYAVLSQKYSGDRVLFVDSIAFDAPKTVLAKEVLANLSGVREGIDMVERKKNAALIILPEANDVVARSFANLNNVKVRVAGAVSALDVATHRYVIVVDPETVSADFEKRAHPARPQRIKETVNA